MHHLPRLLLAVELICLAAALALGVLWTREPTGPFEPWAFLMTLVGGAGIDVLRRYAKNAEATFSSRQVAMLRAIVSGKRVDIEANAGSTTSKQIYTEVRRIMDQRRNLLHMCEQLALLRGQTVPNAADLPSALGLPPNVTRDLSTYIRFVDHIEQIPPNEIVKAVKKHHLIGTDLGACIRGQLPESVLRGPS